MNCLKEERHILRKCVGVLILFIEMNLLGGTIFGFPSLFTIFSQMNIYQHLCSSSEGQEEEEHLNSCQKQIQQYQNALTLGIAFFDLPALIIGILIDRFGCRFVKVLSISFHVIGWLALALLKPGRDYLIYIHSIFSSLSGITIVLTSYTSSNYFSQSRAFVSSLLVGAGISSTMWFAIYQILINNGYCQLNTLSYLWLSFGLLMLLTSFLFLDWNYSYFNLPYKYNIELELNHLNQLNEKTFCQCLFSSLYLLVISYLSILLIPTVFLSMIWKPFLTFLFNNNHSLEMHYTSIYNISIISSIIICPLNGYLLGYKANESLKRKLLNISIVQTISWSLNVCLCFICMFSSSSSSSWNSLIAILIFNCLSRSTIVAGCQSVLSTFFPSKYIGRLTGIMWSFVGLLTFIQFGLVQLTNDITQIWKAWIVILSMIFVMLSHLIQIWMKYFQQTNQQQQQQQQTIDLSLNNMIF